MPLGIRVERCVCGSRVVVEGFDVAAAVALHNRGGHHLRWRLTGGMEAEVYLDGRGVEVAVNPMHGSWMKSVDAPLADPRLARAGSAA